MFNCYKENVSSTIILDDIDALLTSRVAVGILKSATTENMEGERKIYYASSTSKEDDIYAVFEGKTFLLCNSLPLNSDLSAIASRSICYNFNPSNDELIEQIEAFNNKDDEIIQYLKALFGQNNSLNFRHYFKAVELKKMYPSEWKDILMPLLNLNDRYGVIQNILNNTVLSVEEQVELYKKETGKSRASFFRDKKQGVI